ncbi:dihydrofolate reductase [Pseudochrobactrum saccharolyticum]|uniref:Dihydrofolate reductase n=2 Tax=Pseudochrobactrum saccharolyticum TaxID=354352 RepID=A0A7W8AMD9_9HYPH|nr:dihydrofolate reductase [Pseudochrobactrum saccharolyticum]KAB0537714.1 dihydrofolate reductase [Pseudochrobactrum saccharolyticum]MBB5091900.1 dihydrofolate reductase [Pseudochrobactrum saccharolyticum]
MIISFVVAVSENGVIGRDNGMPWRLSTDLQRFKKLTLGKPVVMGRKTWESLGRPLPNRTNIVITRDAGYSAEGALVVPSIDEALIAGEKAAREAGADEICIIGGAQIYAQAMDKATRLHVTHIKASIDGDAFFGPVDPQVWQITSEEDVPAGEKDNYPTRYVVYDRL